MVINLHSLKMPLTGVLSVNADYNRLANVASGEMPTPSKEIRRVDTTRTKFRVGELLRQPRRYELGSVGFFGGFSHFIPLLCFPSVPLVQSVS